MFYVLFIADCHSSNLKVWIIPDSKKKEERTRCFQNCSSNCLSSSSCMGRHIFLSNCPNSRTFCTVFGFWTQLSHHNSHVQSSYEEVQGRNHFFQRMSCIYIVLLAGANYHSFCLVSSYLLICPVLLVLNFLPTIIGRFI